MKKIVALIFLSALLASCSVYTPYQSYSFNGGYKEQKLAEDIYKVEFYGNANTPEDVVENYTLRRCADLTKNEGYKYFIILNDNGKDNAASYTMPSYVNTNSYGNVYANGNYGTYSGSSNSEIMGGQTLTTHNYSHAAVMKMLKSNKQFPTAFNADIILSNYAKKQ